MSLIFLARQFLAQILHVWLLSFPKTVKTKVRLMREDVHICRVSVWETLQVCRSEASGHPWHGLAWKTWGGGGAGSPSSRAPGCRPHAAPFSG